ncbi:MAG: preprotein translocase subunit YajC [Lachnospiraceae bacterium]|nr:preprotein translocase subunit YajC [Lachnospiraceae bacterium]
MLIIYIFSLIAVVYFFLIRPQQKKKKMYMNMLSALQKGDEILTVGGLFGIVTDISDERIIIAVKDGTELEFDKRAIAEIIPERKSENQAAD